jgi:hypothetical protein
MKTLEYYRYPLSRHQQPLAVPVAAYVVYAMVKPGVCVFSGVVASTCSTINAAEDIIRLICEREHIGPRDCVFYDLQTAMGYRKPISNFEYDRLVLEKKELRVKEWIPEPCPLEVIELFSDFIGLHPNQATNW